jgi:hypothetical protein
MTIMNVKAVTPKTVSSTQRRVCQGRCRDRHGPWLDPDRSHDRKGTVILDPSHTTKLIAEGAEEPPAAQVVSAGEWEATRGDGYRERAMLLASLARCGRLL